MSRGLAIACVLSAALLVAGCNAVTSHDPRQGYAADADAAVSFARSSHGPYVLRPTDQVRVLVYNEPSISGDFVLDSGGSVSIPLAGRIKASGMTTAELERVITARLSNGLINDPKVNVQVASYTPFYIHGEVKRSGEFPYRPGLTVMDAIATAGGFTYRADERKAFVRRAGTTIEAVYPLNARIPVYPGDNIRIPERFF
jgi:protein involved in polysaccharide export with SLBB domain